jgi:hypothetical protein
MNPSTGTFTSPDAYAGTIFDPVSLHKYLYANANPVMNRDPSGYVTYGELLGAMAINAVLGAAIGGLSGLILNVLFYDTHGGDMFSSERNKVAWEGFWKGALFGAAGGAIFGGLGILGTEFIFANVLSGIILYFQGLNCLGQAAQFYMNGDTLWGDIYYIFSGIIFIGSGVNLIKSWSMAFDDYYVPSSVGKAGAADDVLRGLGGKSEAYLTKRGWTWDSIRNLTKNKFTTRVAVNKSNGNPATAYFNEAGDYVVVDDITGDLVQLSQFGDADWIPDSSIIDPYKPKS